MQASSLIDTENTQNPCMKTLLIPTYLVTSTQKKMSTQKYQQPFQVDNSKDNAFLWIL